MPVELEADGRTGNQGLHLHGLDRLLKRAQRLEGQGAERALAKGMEDIGFCVGVMTVRKVEETTTRYAYRTQYKPIPYLKSGPNPKLC